MEKEKGTEKLNNLSSYCQKVVEPEFYFIVHDLNQYSVKSTGHVPSTFWVLRTYQ